MSTNHRTGHSAPLWKTIAVTPTSGAWFNVFAPEGGGPPFAERCPALLLQEVDGAPDADLPRTVFASHDRRGVLDAACEVTNYLCTVHDSVLQDVLAALAADDDCIEWLRDYLTRHGRSLRDDVTAAAAHFAAPEAVRRAAIRLGVRTERTREVPSRAYWSLPGLQKGISSPAADPTPATDVLHEDISSPAAAS